MEKLTNNRIYLDFNATSPFAGSVNELLAKGDFSFANPASIHSSGKRSRKIVNDCNKYLLELFGLNGSHGVVFHSGASEGINTLVKGLGHFFYKKKEPFTYFYFKTDHSASTMQAEYLRTYGHNSVSFEVDKNGEFDLKEIIHQIKNTDGQKLLNFLWVHNETGVVWSLEDAKKIKEETGCLIHIDSVQSAGKIENWKLLNSELDYYTYSGHKFGSLKGIGFSLIKNQSPYAPLILGGGQQSGMRSGTENALAIQSIELALKELEGNFDYKKLSSAKQEFEILLAELLGEKGEIVGKGAKQRNGNTVFFILKEGKFDLILTALDLIGIDVGIGSACSSGLSEPNRVLQSMGYRGKETTSAIRVSFSPYLRMENMKEYFQKIESTLKKHLKI